MTIKLQLQLVLLTSLFLRCLFISMLLLVKEVDLLLLS